MVETPNPGANKGADHPPRADASTLHVDFEKVTDTLVMARNAGVFLDPWTRDPSSRIRILDSFGFQGRRCAHIAATGATGTSLRLLRAHDAPRACADAVLEFVYRPVLEKPIDLSDWLVLRCETPGGKPVALELRAIGHAPTGTYSVDVIAGGARFPAVLDQLPQHVWTRFILHRCNSLVDLYAGMPDAETHIGSYADLSPEGETYAILFGNCAAPAARGAGYWDAVRLGRPLRTGKELAAAEERIRNVGTIVAKPPCPLHLGREKHLFIDDWSIEQSANIHRTFHRPRKHPDNPLIVPDRIWESISGPGEGGAIYLFGGVERQASGLYRMWYYAADPTPANRKNAHTCIALSEDGIHWTKPALGIHPYAGSTANNISIMESGPYSLIIDPADSRPEFRYKTHLRYRGTSGWSSADGLHWTSHGIILPQSLDASSLHWDPLHRKYIASIKLWFKKRRYRGYAESEDFLHWSDTYLMMDVDELDVCGDQIYAMKIFRYESLYLGLAKIYHVETSDTCDIHLAISHNGTCWQRPFRPLPGPGFATPEKTLFAYADTGSSGDEQLQPFIPTGPPGAWDFGNNDTAGTPPIREGDELRFYYSGRSHTHNGGFPPGGVAPYRHGGCIGLATLRVDGFVSADADASGAWLLTRPLELAGTELYVNAAAGAGNLRVEILDEQMRPLAPFALTRAEPIRSDAVRIRCRWQGTDNLAALAGRPLRLKFHLLQASLYAFWCE